MKLHRVDVRAVPVFDNAKCPKGHGDMIQLDNGWFRVCWYCKRCGYPYELVMRKMENVNEEALAKVLAEQGVKP